MRHATPQDPTSQAAARRPAATTALDGRYRPEHLTELRLCLRMWDAYQAAIADLDPVIAAHLKGVRKDAALPPLPPQTRVRGREPHDPKFDVRAAPYLATGVDLTAVEGSTRSTP